MDIVILVVFACFLYLSHHDTFGADLESGLLFTTTETIFESVTTTISITEIDTTLLIATVSAFSTAEATSTVIVTPTVTQINQPIANCNPSPGPFQAWFQDTSTGTNPLYMYANLLNGLPGGLNWQAASSSTAATVKNRYIFIISSDGFLVVAYNVPPYTYKYMMYMSTAVPGSNWPQIGTEASVNAQVAAGAAATKIKACVNSVTEDLTLDAVGRRNILWCGQQLWMSFGNGNDIGRGVCVQAFPKAVLGY